MLQLGPAMSPRPQPRSTTPGAETYVDIEPALGYPVYLHTFAAGQFSASAYVEPGRLPSSLG